MDSFNKPNGSVGPGSDAGDEAASRVASSPGPDPGLASEIAFDGELPTFAGEPEAPVGPGAVVDDERGADQDPEAVDARLASEPLGSGAAASDADATVDGEPVLEHQRVAADLEELAAKAAKADEYLELAQRTKADFENYRKRAVREAKAAQERGVAKLARELLPAVDNLDRALAAAQASAEAVTGEASDNGTANLVSGIRLVHADVIAALGRVGIEPYSPEGEPFDPQHHEAVAQQPVDGAQPGTIVEVYQRGYRLGDFVLRPARVLVAG